MTKFYTSPKGNDQQGINNPVTHGIIIPLGIPTNTLQGQVPPTVVVRPAAKHVQVLVLSQCAAKPRQASLHFLLMVVRTPFFAKADCFWLLLILFFSAWPSLFVS